MIKHVSFDIWNTILKSNPDFYNARAEYLKSISPLDLTIEEIHGVVKGVGTRSDFYELHEGCMISPVMRLKEILREIGISNQPVWEHDEYLESLTLKHLPEFIDRRIILVLQQLREFKVHISITSNTGNLSGELMRTILDRLRILDYFDFELFSDEVRGVKPHSKIFNELITRSTVKPEEILHIGDNQVADIDGAQKHGITALLFNPNEPNYADILHNYEFCSPYEVFRT